MFVYQFADIGLEINGRVFPISLEGECDVHDYDDAWEPAIIEIRIGDEVIERRDPLFSALATGIMQECGSDIAERFRATIPVGDDNAEHRLSLAQMGV